MKEFWEEVNSLVKPRRKVVWEYRLYCKGDEILYTVTEPSDENTDNEYIVITQEQYKLFRPGYGKIVDGKLVHLVPLDPNKKQLEKADDGEYCTVKDNMIFVADEGDRYREIIRYE